MRREQDDDAPLGEFDERLFGPAQKGVELKATAQRPEVHRQEGGERDTREPMDQRDQLHRNTASTARMPIHASSSPNASTNHSRERPRQPSHSVSTARRPIGACTAPASTNAIWKASQPTLPRVRP